MAGPDGAAARAVLAALSRRGYAVTRAEDPAGLGERAGHDHALVVLVDAGWPADDAEPSFAHAKQYVRLLARAGASLLVITERDGAEELAQLVAAGADDFLAWPRDKASLRARLLALEGAQRVRVAARDSQAELRALLRAFPDAAHLTLEPDGVITGVSVGAPRGAEVPGGASHAWIGQRLDEVLAAQHGPRMLEAVRRAADDDEVLALVIDGVGAGETLELRLVPTETHRVLGVLQPTVARRFPLGTDPPRGPRPSDPGERLAAAVDARPLPDAPPGPRGARTDRR